MLLVTLYHRIDSGKKKYKNNYKTFYKHIDFIKNNFNVVVPGDNLIRERLNVCLSFDDGYEEIYLKVYPLLKELNLKAILAISPVFIGKSEYCTINQLKEMRDTFVFASHGFNHVDLSHKEVDLKKEIIESKRVLEEMLETKIETFVFPFGKFNKCSLDIAKNEYKYIFRIGNALNINFNGINGIVYRINCDDLKSYDEPFKLKNLIKYSAKSLIKRIFSE